MKEGEQSILKPIKRYLWRAWPLSGCIAAIPCWEPKYVSHLFERMCTLICYMCHCHIPYCFKHLTFKNAMLTLLCVSLVFETGVICLSSTFIPNGKIILTEKISAVLQLYSINLKVILNNLFCNIFFVCGSEFCRWCEWAGDVFFKSSHVCSFVLVVSIVKKSWSFPNSPEDICHTPLSHPHGFSLASRSWYEWWYRKGEVV